MKNFNKIAELLSQQAEETVRYLLPRGKVEGNEWCVGSIDGEVGKSLKIRLHGKKAGIWCDFSHGGDYSGDLLDLWAATRKISLLAALKEAQEYLGLINQKFDGYKKKNFTRPSSIKIASLKSPSVILDYLINNRMLNPKTINDFKIGEHGRDIVFPYWRDNELTFLKYLSLDRPNGKKQIRTEANCEPCLFGWHLISPNTRSIAICEGELDAMSLYQLGVPSLSVPFGGGVGDKHKWIECEYDRLAIFDEIFLCFDSDSSGDAAAIEIASRLGRHRCRIVSLPYKDANECLQRGITVGEINKCFQGAKFIEPEELKSAGLYADQVIDEFYPRVGKNPGYNPPWQYAQGKIFFRPDELNIWCGINGHGKSQLLGHVILSLMTQGARVCVASLEIKPKKLLMRMTRQASAIKEPTEDYIRKIHDWYGDKLWLFDLVGTTKVDRLLEVFLYAHQRYGVDVFVIDSFMKCGIDEDDFKAQKIFIEKLCDFKNQFNCQIHIVAHPRKTSDESQMPGKLDIKGTGAISDLADNCFTVWRNKEKEDLLRQQSNGNNLDHRQLEKLNKPDCIWRCDKQRNGEWEGSIALWFEPNSFQYLGHPKLKPTQFVEFSKSHQ